MSILRQVWQALTQLRASNAIFGRPTATQKAIYTVAATRVHEALASITSIASARLVEGLDHISAQYVQRHWITCLTNIGMPMPDLVSALSPLHCMSNTFTAPRNNITRALELPMTSTLGLWTLPHQV